MSCYVLRGRELALGLLLIGCGGGGQRSSPSPSPSTSTSTVTGPEPTPAPGPEPSPSPSPEPSPSPSPEPSTSTSTITSTGTDTKVETGMIRLKLDSTTLQQGIDLEPHVALLSTSIEATTACITKKGSTYAAGAVIKVTLALDKAGKVKKVKAEGIADKQERSCAEKAWKQLKLAAPAGGGPASIVLPLVVEQP